MTAKYPNIEVRIPPGNGVGEKDHPFFPQWLAGGVFGELHRVEAPDRKEFIVQAMREADKGLEAVISYASSWVTIIDEKGFRVTG